MGLISFSFYLWHFPLFVFTRIYLVSDLNLTISIFLIFVSLFLSYLSWKYIEKPFRNPKVISDKKLLIYFILSFFIILGTASLFYSNKIYKKNHELPKEISNSMNRLDPEKNCFDIDFAHLKETDKWFCNIGIRPNF